MRYFFSLIISGIKIFGESLQSLVLLIFRLVWGYGFFQAGLGKFLHLAKTMDSFKELGIPFPELNAFLVAFVECFGGLCLLLGLGARFAGYALSIVMIMAFLLADFDSVQQFFVDPLEVTRRTPFPFLLAALTVLAFGPGRISLDYLFERNSIKPEDER